MEKNYEFGYHQHPYRMSPNNLSLFGFHSEIGHLNSEPICEIPHSVEESTFMFPISGFQQSNANNSQDWLYNNTLHYHNPFPPLFNPAPYQNFPAFDFGRKTIPSMLSTLPERKFLIFDQSCAKTTLYDSKVQFGASRVLKNPPTVYKLSDEGHIRVGSPSKTTEPPLRSIDNYEATEEKEGEMHEDTEELDALLSSDDEYDDDEEKSTGHSPSTITINGLRDPVEKIGEDEEVDSFASRPTTKRRRIPDLPSALGDEDAESVYIGFDKLCNKRVRRDKIHETLRVLRGLIPDTEGKDGVVVIDEAVDYLRSLKVKAKVLGLDAL